ncbi:retrovirus-related pol polyprotein from transposon TNT 1-94 [Tanacetum coccineum]
MHNNIMAAGSRDRPPMLATRRYAQWRSRFLRYIDTRPNGDALRKCILEGPYTPTTVIIPAVPATDNSPAVPERTTIETVLNMSPENKAHFKSEKEAIHLILTGIGDEIYSTVDACKTAHEMWEAIERLQQGESLNIQDVKTNLFWEFGQFTSHDGETIESYYTRFYKLMNEMIRNNLTVATMQVNVQFLQQLQPEWSRFVTIVKQQHKLDEVSYHKLFDILKQYQKEVNELCAERIAKNANPLALVATAQPYQDPYYQTSKSHKSSAPTSKALLPTRSHASTRHKGKETAKPITPLSESASEEDSYPEQAQKDKEINKNVDTTPRYKNDNQSVQFRNQRTMTVAGARETVGGQVVQQSGIQCFNCKEFDHFAKECRNPKRVKDSTYHKEKMLLYTDEEIDEQELEALYSYMAKIQEVLNADSGTDSKPMEQVQYDIGYNVFANKIQHFKQSESISNTCVVETGDRNVIPDSPDMCDNDIQNDQNDVKCDDARVVLANLIANLKIDVDENKKIQKQLKKENTTLAHELTECKSILAETSRILEESNSIRDSCLVALQNKQTKLEKYKTFNDRTVDYEKLEHKELVDQAWVKHSKDHFRAPTAHDMKILIKTCLMPLALKIQNDSLTFVHELKQEMHADLKIPKPSVLGKPAPFSDSLERKIFSKKKSVPKTNESEGLSKPVTLQNLPQIAKQAVRNTNVIKPGMYRIESRTTQNRAPQLPQTYRNTNPRVSTSTGVTHRTNVSRPQTRNTQMKDKVVPNISQVKYKKTEIEDHHRISSIYNQTKSVTACNDSLKSRTSNVNVVCTTCRKCMFNSNHDACVSKYLNDVNARTKKPKVVPISTRKPKSQANKSVATHRKKTVASEFTVQNSKSYYRMLYEKTSKA